MTRRWGGLLSLVVAVLTAIGVVYAGHGVPVFRLSDLEGDAHSLDDYDGKMVVVNYWATWCPPCLRELPELIDFHNANAQRDAVVLGVAYDDIERSELETFVDEHFIDYPVFAQTPGTPSPFGKIVGLPTTFIISADRKSVKAHVGPLNTAVLNGYLQKYGPPLR